MRSKNAKLVFLLSAFFLCSLSLSAQTERQTVEKKQGTEDRTKIFADPKVCPRFEGNIKEYLKQHIKYPMEAASNGEQGRVVLGFLVKKDGSLKGIKVMRSVSKALDREAIRVVKGMPKWIPGTMNGKPCNMYYTLPVEFKLL